MQRLATLLLVVGLGVSACAAGPAASPDAGPIASGLEGCTEGAPLRGASYDVAKSRFAFGSTPVRQIEGSLTRWVGDHGVVAIWPSGAEGASLNGGAPESTLPDWSADPDALAKHVRSYFLGMGVAECQVARAGVNAGSGGRTIALARGVDGVPVAESLAWARFDVDDQTTGEGFYWPEIPSDVVAAARALHTRLSDPAALAAYKATLPAEAQGEGLVLIHHTYAFSADPFTAAATYDVLVGRTTRAFDADGKEVTGL